MKPGAIQTGVINHVGFTLTATHEVYFVIFSVAIGIVASYTALSLFCKVTLKQGRASNLWLIGGAIAIGIGIWSMHFITRFVYHLPIPMKSDLAISVVTLIILSLTLLVSVFDQWFRSETARREEELHQTKERFRNFVETTSDWFWEVDQNAVYTYASPQIRNILGYEPEEVLGKTPFDLMSAKEAKRVAEIFGPIAAAKQPFTCLENSNIHKDGHQVVLETSGVPLLNPDGSLRGYRGVDRDITERKRVEATVAASEAELRALFAAMKDVILVLDAQGRYLKLAPTNPDILYKPAAELVGKTLHEVFPHSQADTFLEQIRHTLNIGETVNIEYSLQIGTQEVWFSGAISPMLEDTVIFVAHDITERKQAEEALRESETRLRLCLEAGQMVTWDWNIQSNHTTYSDQMGTLFGLHPGEDYPTYEAFLNSVYVQDRELVTQAVNRALEEGLDYEVEFRVIWSDGSRHWIVSRGQVYWDETGKPLRMMGVTMDITERKQAEEALRQSEKRFRSLVEQAADGFFLHDLSGRFIDVNQQACNSLGYTREELLSLSVLDVEQNLIPETIMPQLLEQLISGIAVTHSGVHKRKDGTTFPVEIRLGLFDVDGCQNILALVRDISDRAAAEEALRQSEQRFRAIFNQTHQLIGLLQPNGTLVEVNQTALDCIGVQLEDVVGLPFWETPWWNSPLENQIKLKQAIAKAAAGEFVQLEVQITDLNGIKHTYDNTIKPIKDETGQVILLIPEARDITERKQAEEAWRKTEVRNRALLNAIPDLMIRMTRNGTYLDFRSPKGFKTVMPREEIIGKNLFDTMPLEVCQQRMHYVEQALQTGDTQIYEYQFLWNDSIQHEEARILVSGEDEVLVIIRDITERKQAEEALRRSEQKLSLHIQQTPLAVIEWNTNFVITEWNPAAEAIFGYSKNEVVGQHGAEILIPEYTKEQVNEVLDDLLTLKGGTRSTNENVTKDGRTIFCEWYNTPLVDQTGRVIGVASLAQDITERKQAEVELQKAIRTAEAANRAKSEFLANMSHEIRTPMNGVIGMTGLLLDTALAAQQRDFVETIRSCGDALLTIINDILDFSKIESGKLDLEQQPLELGACIESALDLLAPKAAEKNLELLYVIESQTPNRIVSDVTRLRQILVNLISNAVKFTDTGEVVVSVTAQRQKAEGRRQKVEENSCTDSSLLASGSFYEIQFAVKDTGIGIAPDKIERLFQSFSQVDSSITRQYGGTGLGLAISKRLSEIMGGRMWVKSQLGIGSTFYFTILAASVPETMQVDYYHPQLQLSGKRLLIVDDNATNRKILALQAHSWGMKSSTAASGVEAIDLICRGEQFDIAVLDMQMPQMDGLTLAAEIRRHPHCQKLPLVMLTSMGKQELAVSTANLNFAAYLNKPIKQSQLYNVLLQILSEQPIKVASSPTISPQIDPQLAQAHPLRILLAEDNIVNQKVALQILQQMGYRADVAGNGLEVLEALQRQPYDVVLMDVQMPEMDGLTATRCICQQWSSQQRPWIIAITANAMQGDREECIQAGMDDYLSKPLRVEQLIKALSKCQPNKEGLGTRDWGLEEYKRTRGQGDKGQSDCSLHPTLDLKALQALQEIAGEDASTFMTTIIDTFLEDAPNLLQEIESAIASADAVVLQRAAHTLKSSSATFGAMTLSQLCKQLEAIARAGTIETVAPIVSQIQAEYGTVKAALQIQRQEYHS